MIIKYLSVILVTFLKIPLYHQLILENTIVKQNGSTTETPIKSRLLYDYQTHAVAFKDLIESKCILEILTGSESVISKWNSSGRRGSISKDFLDNELLSKRQIWRLAGDRITEFCRGFPTYLIKNRADGSQDILNDIPNYIEKARKKRATSHYFQGRVRGQTQSQYLNFGKSDEPGKAEAETSFEGSKAVVSGNNGMGQAQSQSLPFDCGDCYGKDQEQALEVSGYPSRPYPEPIIQGPGVSFPDSNIGHGRPWTGMIPSGPAGSGQTPISGQISSPGQIPIPGQISSPGQIPIPGQVSGPGQIPIPGEVTGPGQISIPGQVSGPGQISIPGQVFGPGQTEGPTQTGTWSRPGSVSDGNGRYGSPGQVSTPQISGTGPTFGQNQGGGPKQTEGWPKQPTQTPNQVLRWPGQTGGSLSPTDDQGQRGAPSQIGGWPGQQRPTSSGRELVGGVSQTGGWPDQNQRPTTNWPGQIQLPGQVGGWPGRIQSPAQVGGWPGQIQAGNLPEKMYRPGQTEIWPGQTQGPQGPVQTTGQGINPAQTGTWQNQGPISGQPGRLPQQIGWPSQTGGPEQINAPIYTGKWTEPINEPSGQNNAATGPLSPNSGSFGGKLAGDYQSNQGNSGRFSGQFSGQYESYGPRGPPAGQANVWPETPSQRLPGNEGGTAHIGGPRSEWPGHVGDTGQVGGTSQHPGDIIQYPGQVGGWPSQVAGTGQIVEPNRNVNWPGGTGQIVPGQVGHWPNQVGRPGEVGGWPGQVGGSGQVGGWPGQGTGGTGPGQIRGPEQTGGTSQNGYWPSQIGGTGQVPIPGQVGQGGGTGQVSGWPGRAEGPGAGGTGQIGQGGGAGRVSGWPGRAEGSGVGETGQVGRWPNQMVDTSQSIGPSQTGQGGGTGQIGSWPGQIGSAVGPVGGWPGSIGNTGQIRGPGQTGDTGQGGASNQVGSWPGQMGRPGQHELNLGGGWPGQMGGREPVEGTGQPIIPEQGRGVNQGGGWPGQAGYGQSGNWPIQGRGPEQNGRTNQGGWPGQIGSTGRGSEPNQFGAWPGQVGDSGRIGGGPGQKNSGLLGSSDRAVGGQISDGRYSPTSSNDDSDSQVQTSVQQTDNGTAAQAQAQGTFGGGTAQSQVSGTHSGSGSFSASAGSDDGKRGAQTQVSGGKEGAQSAAQGKGGLGQSQSQVSLSLETGQTSSSAQSGGMNHGTQSQVLASEKGGLADAQSNGPGSTSSQAQIGFVPYDEQESDNDTEPFKGGGTAGARSGSFSGMSQSQVQGKFRFGVKYSGAAQAASGGTGFGKNYTRSGPFNPTEINFNVAKEKLSQKQTEQAVTSKNHENNVTAATPTEIETPTIKPISTKKASHKQTNNNKNKDYKDDDDDYYEDYEDETEKPKTRSIITQSDLNQRQHIVLDPLEDLDLTVHQSKGVIPSADTIIQPGETVPGYPGYKIPSGFRGTVKSLANGPNTYAIGKHSQAQSATLSPGTGKIIYKKPFYAVTSNTHSTNGQYSYGSGYTYQPAYSPVSYQLKSGRILPNFISVSKSETGSTNLDTGKKTPSVYYTQSSSCGIFTNQCIFNGGRKLCFPKAKTNPDGTIMGC